MWRILISMSCVSCMVLAQGKEDSLQVKPQREGDAVKVTVAEKQTTLDITSKRGIGGAAITRTTDKWPAELLLKIHLRGLEQFTMTAGKTSLKCSVLSHSGNMRLISTSKDGEEKKLKEGDELWTAIKVMDKDGKPVDGLPPDGGWFELIVPAALLAPDQKTLDLHWIDFYR